MAGSNKTTSATTVPAYLQEAGKAALTRGTDISKIGYTPYYGPDVAAMTPSQIAAMQGTNTAASAFGLPTVDPMAGMPAATDYNGMSAYSSGSGYDAAIAELKARFPGQFAAIMAQFIDPVTGAARAGADSPTRMGRSVQAPAGRSGGGGIGYTGGGSGDMFGFASNVRSYLPGGVNTANPNSLLNTIVGKALNAANPQGAPTAANRPMARPTSVASKPAASKPKAAKTTVTREDSRR